jgi:hypothetical protein
VPTRDISEHTRARFNLSIHHIHTSDSTNIYSKVFCTHPYAQVVCFLQRIQITIYLKWNGGAFRLSRHIHVTLFIETYLTPTACRVSNEISLQLRHTTFFLKDYSSFYFITCMWPELLDCRCMHCSMIR